MRSRSRPNLCLALIPAAALCICTAASAETIGSPLQQRQFKDVDAGQVYVYASTSSPFQFDAVASSISFYDAATAGGIVTPLLFEKTGASSYRLRGIGTSRASNASGLQSYPFALISGSDAVTAGSYTFGFTNRTYTPNSNGIAIPGSSTTGVVPYDHPGMNVPVDDWLMTATLTTLGPVTLSLGTTFGPGGIAFYNSPAGGRVYSASFTTVVPEPVSASLTVIAAALAGRRRRCD